MVEKITRAAFIYLAPKFRDDKYTLAQCGSCRMFVPTVPKLSGARCIIHGSDVEIDEDDSCGFWVDWPTKDGTPNPKVVGDHREELTKGIAGSVTADESGLVDDKVQCHRCEFFDAEESECGLYKTLNKMDDLFDLDIDVKPNACCNAWTGKDDDDGKPKKKSDVLYGKK